MKEGSSGNCAALLVTTILEDKFRWVLDQFASMPHYCTANKEKRVTDGRTQPCLESWLMTKNNIEHLQVPLIRKKSKMFLIF